MMTHDGEHHDPLTVDQVKHAVRKLAEQRPTSAGFRIYDDVGRRLCFDPTQGDSNSEQKVFGGAYTPVAIP